MGTHHLMFLSELKFSTSKTIDFPILDKIWKEFVERLNLI